MTIGIERLGPGDASVLRHVATGVFDGPVDETRTAELLADPRHHLVVALDDGLVVGFASGVTYLHPDKPLELWIDEVGVASTHRGRGIGRRVLDALLEAGRASGCREAWVLTERSNDAARRLYISLGGCAAPDETTMYTFTLDRPEPPATG